MAATSILRPGLLDGRAVALAGGAAAIATACAELGGRIETLDATQDEDALHQAVTGLTPLDALVCDTRARVAQVGLQAALEQAWNATRAVVNAAFRPAGAGKVVYVAPPPNGEHGSAARAALENLARTTSIEWARYGITTAAILPGDATVERDLADLAAYVVSEAGAYFSGCAFTLGGL
jgi:hypothetical protein